ALDFDAGGHLQSYRQRGVRMLKTVVDHPYDRVFGTLSHLAGSFNVRLLQRGHDQGNFMRFAFATLPPPPEGPFAENGNRSDGTEQDGPHDRPALEKELEYNVC